MRTYIRWLSTLIAEVNCNRTSIARTALGLWTFVLDIGSSSPKANHSARSTYGGHRIHLKLVHQGPSCCKLHQTHFCYPECIHNLTAVKLQWLELVYRGWFELVFETVGNYSDSSRIQVFRDILTLVLLRPDIPCLWKQCRFRSVGFWRSQLIWICTVCH